MSRSSCSDSTKAMPMLLSLSFAERSEYTRRGAGKGRLRIRFTPGQHRVNRVLDILEMHLSFEGIAIYPMLQPALRVVDQDHRKVIGPQHGKCFFDSRLQGKVRKPRVELQYQRFGLSQRRCVCGIFDDDRQKLHIVISSLFAQRNEEGQKMQAGAAPVCPHVDDRDAASAVRENLGPLGRVDRLNFRRR